MIFLPDKRFEKVAIFFGASVAGMHCGDVKLLIFHFH